MKIFLKNNIKKKKKKILNLKIFGIFKIESHLIFLKKNPQKQII